MLTESEKLLITAAVDGQLPPAEAEAFDRLVMSDPEAARLFRRLKEASARLAALPKRPAPKGLAAAVMARVRPTTPARRTPARGSLLPFIIAASLFLAVTTGSFLFFRTRPTDADHAQQHLPPVGSSVVPDVPAGEPRAVAKGGRGEDGAVKPADAAGAVAKLLPVEVEPVVVQVPKPLTPEEKALFGVGLMVESKPLKQVEPTVPLVLSGLEFGTDESQAKLKKELARDGGFRLNLFSKNTAAAVEHLQAAARTAGVHVFVEGMTAKRIKEPMALPYAVYLENLTADELAAVLAGLSKQVNEQPKPEAVLGAAHFVPADVPEQKDLKELLGLDWAVPKAAKPADGKAVSDGTLKEVVASVKKGEKAAVVVTYAPKLNAGKSSEVKLFVDKRGERKAGSVPLLIVVRPQG